MADDGRNIKELSQLHFSSIEQNIPGLPCSFPMRSGNLTDCSDKNPTFEVQVLLGQSKFFIRTSEHGAVLELLDPMAETWGGLAPKLGRTKLFCLKK